MRREPRENEHFIKWWAGGQWVGALIVLDVAWLNLCHNISSLYIDMTDLGRVVMNIDVDFGRFSLRSILG